MCALAGDQASAPTLGGLMPRLHFKRFSDQSFLQALDKPRWLRPLLEDHADYFGRHGINVRQLKNDAATGRKLLDVFTAIDEEIPPDLLEALYILDDLSDEAGHDRILEEAEWLGIDLGKVGQDLNVSEFAIGVYLEQPGIIRSCHERTLHRKIKNYEEYQSQGNGRLTLGVVRKKRGQLENQLGAWFESKNRSKACEIHVYEEDGDLKFQITHGRPMLTEGSINKKLALSRVAYRPQKHDSVVYDKAAGVLKVNAQTHGEKQIYRSTFGEVLFGDADFFPGERLYTLEPLQAENISLATPAGVSAARLAEVWIRLDDAQQVVQITRARDLLECVNRTGRPVLSEGTLLRAAFLVTYASGGRARKLEIRPPNVAIYDRERDAAPAVAFIRANGFGVQARR